MKPYLLLLFILLYSAAQAQDPILDANKCYEEQKYECAVAKYKEALLEKKYQEKSFGEIKFRIGFGLVKLNQLVEAETYLKEALAFKPNWGRPLWELAGLYYNSGKYDKALEHYDLAIPQYSGDTANLKSLYFWKGKSLASLGRYSEANNAYGLGIAIDSTQDYLLAGNADAYYNAGKYKEAISAYQRSIDKIKGQPATKAERYYWMGKASAALKKYDEAITSYKNALATEPAHKNAVWSIASALFNQEKYKEALDQYNKTITVYKGDSASLAMIYYWRGRTNYKLKDLTRAVADFDQTIAYNKWYEDAHWQKADILRIQKKYKEAIPVYTTAIDLFYDLDDSSLDDLYFFRGFCYFSLKDTVKAEADFRTSYDENRSLADPQLFLGHISFAKKNYYDAKTFYGASAAYYITDSAEKSVIYFRKGFSNLMLGDAYLYSAREDLQRSVDYDSTNKIAQRNLADAFFRQKNYALAERVLTKCITLYKSMNDSLSAMYLYRGSARAQQSKFKDALADFEQADKLLPFKNADNLKYMAQLAYNEKDYTKVNKMVTRLILLYKPEQKDQLLYAYFLRGCAFVEAKKKADAVKDLKKALEYSPGHKDITPWLTKAEALP